MTPEKGGHIVLEVSAMAQDEEEVLKLRLPL
jgi:hypothetical protein